MNGIHRLFDGLHQNYKENRKLLSAYLMPGFPRRDSTLSLLEAAESAGADFVELGVPFSDPLADGPVIQNASQKAIENGITPIRVLDAVKEFRKKSHLPIILMGYMNSFMNGMGPDAYRKLCASGVDGVIVPDLSLEESPDFKRDVEESGLSLVLLVAPTSDDERIQEIDRASSDFSYCVSVTGVTGARKNLVSNDVVEFLRRVKRLSRKPFVVGFGISTPETAREISTHADGIVVGSALLQQIAGASAGNESKAAFEFLRSLRESIDRSSQG